jgi:hypothetical protein
LAGAKNRRIIKLKITLMAAVQPLAHWQCGKRVAPRQLFVVIRAHSWLETVNYNLFHLINL